MRSFSFFLLLTVVFFTPLSSCNKEAPGPEPDFSTYAHTNTYEVDKPIQFDNRSSQAVSYEWSFGDGTGSTEEEPVKRYSQPGTYTVTLTATHENGSSKSVSQALTIGYRGIIKVQVLEVPPGELDEDGTGPDLAFGAGTTPGQLSYTPIAENVDTATLPYSWEWSVRLTEEKWYFALIDADDTGNQLLGGWNLDLSNYQSNEIELYNGLDQGAHVIVTLGIR